MIARKFLNLLHLRDLWGIASGYVRGVLPSNSKQRCWIGVGWVCSVKELAPSVTCMVLAVRVPRSARRVRGHAVMAQNAADGGTRHCVLVQLPEPLDAKNKDQKVAADFCDEIGRPRSIAELTKERLRRAARQVRSGASDDGNRPRPATAPPIAAGGDLGFRVFKLDTSNIRAWDPNADDLEGSLLEHADHLAPGRTEQDVLYELLLKLGLDLCVPIETRTIASRTVHTVGAGALFVCLADGLDLNVVENARCGHRRVARRARMRRGDIHGSSSRIAGSSTMSRRRTWRRFCSNGASPMSGACRAVGRAVGRGMLNR